MIHRSGGGGGGGGSGIRGEFFRKRGAAARELWIAYLPMKGIEDTWGATHGDGNPKPSPPLQPRRAASRQTCPAHKGSLEERRPFSGRGLRSSFYWCNAPSRARKTIMKRVTPKIPPIVSSDRSYARHVRIKFESWIVETSCQMSVDSWIIK